MLDIESTDSVTASVAKTMAEPESGLSLGLAATAAATAAASEAPSTGRLPVLVQSVESPRGTNESISPGACGTALSVSGVTKPKFGKPFKGGELRGEFKGSELKRGELPSGEEGRNSEGDGTVNALWLAFRMRSKSLVGMRAWSRLSCGRPKTRDTEAINAVAVTTEDLILKADENILWKEKNSGERTQCVCSW